MEKLTSAKIPPMGLRYVHAEPVERGPGFLQLRLDENHKPPVYLATIRILADRPTAPDTEHVREVAAPVLARLACPSVGDYLEKGLFLARATRALASPQSLETRFEEGNLVFERGREVVTTALEPREREVYRVSRNGEALLAFWFAERGPAELHWTSAAFRADARMKPRAVEHGYSYVPWALAELEPVRALLLAGPRALDLGLPLEVTDQLPRDHRL
jgi:hypothetical protein